MLKRVTCIYFYCKKKIFTSISTYPQESLKIHFESEINQIFRFLLGVVKDLSVLCKKKKMKKNHVIYWHVGTISLRSEAKTHFSFIYIIYIISRKMLLKKSKVGYVCYKRRARVDPIFLKKYF